MFYIIMTKIALSKYLLAIYNIYKEKALETMLCDYYYLGFSFFTVKLLVWYLYLPRYYIVQLSVVISKEGVAIRYFDDIEHL